MRADSNDVRDPPDMDVDGGETTDPENTDNADLPVNSDDDPDPPSSPNIDDGRSETDHGDDDGVEGDDSDLPVNSDDGSSPPYTPDIEMHYEQNFGDPESFSDRGPHDDNDHEENYSSDLQLNSDYGSSPDFRDQDHYSDLQVDSDDDPAPPSSPNIDDIQSDIDNPEHFINAGNDNGNKDSLHYVEYSLK